MMLALLAGVTACGPVPPGMEAATMGGSGGSADSEAPPDDVPQTAMPPGWAVGWWMQAVDDSTATEGRVLVQFEVLEDNTVRQERQTCVGGDIVHTNRWEQLADGAIRILPNPSDPSAPWMQQTGQMGYAHLDLRPGLSCNEILVSGAPVLEGSAVSTRIYTRGHKCMSEGAGDGQCGAQLYCGEPAPPPCE